MQVKIHNSYRSIVAICDSELIGKTFEEGEMQIKVTESFFKGEEKTEKEVLNIIEKGRMEDCNFNIVGKQAVKAALKAGIVSKEGIKYVQGVPIALALL